MNLLQRKPLPNNLENKDGWPWTSPFEQSLPSIYDNTPWPKISVVTPSYNQGQFIEETIRSVLLQRYPNLEFIIIDGGSTDNTLEVIKKYESWISYWVSEPDRGQSHGVNKGIKTATGEILLWLNSDDIVLPGSFKRVAKLFVQSPFIKLVIGQAKMIDHKGREIGRLLSFFSDWEEVVTNPRNSVRQISSFFSRSLFAEYGYLNEDLHISMDNELMVRFTKFISPVIIKDYLTAYRVHPDAKTATQLVKGYRETDITRVRLLKHSSLENKYRFRSANNWLSLFESDNYSRNNRIKFLLRALRIYSLIFFHRRFWSAIRKFLLYSA